MKERGRNRYSHNSGMILSSSNSSTQLLIETAGVVVRVLYSDIRGRSWRRTYSARIPLVP